MERRTVNPSSRVSGSRTLRPSLITAAVLGLSVAAGVLVASAVAATSPTARACPSVKLVKATFGPKAGAVGTPVVTKTPYSKTCTYPGGGVGSTKITFQVDTLASFTAGEKAAGRFGAKIVKVHGLGVAAWTAGVGDIYVFDGHEQIKILALSLEVHSPSTATALVEALARKLV
jgi:hypothetical protein